MKLYTDEGNLNWVFNNTPVFFVRDPIKFPSLNRSHKRHPKMNMPDSDMFWDFHVGNPEGIHELMHLMDLLGDAVSVEDETVVADAVLITDHEDAAAAEDGYIIVQKHLHGLKGWQALSTEQQQVVLGRMKLDNIELDDAESSQKSHKTLTTIEDRDGNEHDILRDNMPLGSLASGEFGTYFIGYSKRIWVIEKMMERMFIGNPPGMHDRILDYSRPIVVTTFFAPSAT